MSGLSLPEVLVAMTLALLLSLSMATLHARILHLSSQTTGTADAQDTLRIALALLEYELSHAGYWAVADGAAAIAGRRADTTPLDVTVTGDCGSDWSIDLDQTVEAWSSGWPLQCAPYAGAVPASGALALRRASTRTVNPEAGLLQLHGDPWGAELRVAGEPVDPGHELRDLVARVYYVSPRSTGNADRPSLRRKTLQRGPRMVDEEIVPGIAGMYILLGIDTDLAGDPGHGQPNVFLPPESATGPVVAIRLRLESDDDARLSMVRTIPLRNGSGP
jgi:type IV pilus assembly protein PilW